MACGKPVIASKTNTPLEGEPPVLVCPNNVARWRETLLDLMDDPIGRRDIGKKSYEFVEQKHSLRMTVAQMLQSITSLLQFRGLKTPATASKHTVEIFN